MPVFRARSGNTTGAACSQSSFRRDTFSRLNRSQGGSLAGVIMLCRVARAVGVYGGKNVINFLSRQASRISHVEMIQVG